MIEIMICIYEGLRRIVNNIIKWLIPYCQVLLQTVNGQRHQYLRTEPLPPVDDTLKKPKKQNPLHCCCCCCMSPDLLQTESNSMATPTEGCTFSTAWPHSLGTKSKSPASCVTCNGQCAAGRSACMIIFDINTTCPYIQDACNNNQHALIE